MNTYMISQYQEIPNKRHVPTILQFIFSILAIILLIAGALLLALMGLSQRSDPLGNSVGVLQVSASMAFAAILMCPSAIYAYLRIKTGKRAETRFGYKRTNWVRISSLLLLAMPFILLLGNAIQNYADLTILLFPLLHILAIILPVFWLVSIALRGLKIGSPQRAWGTFNVGLVLTPGIILFFELAAAFFLLVFSLIFLFSQPDLLEELNYLSQKLSIVYQDPESIMLILEPYLTRPSVLVIGLIFVAVIVPVIEELLKPLGVWFLAGKKLSPTEGFAAGVLSGAGFALFENMAFSSGSSEWGLTVTTRAGTAVVHIVTAAIMGWALVLAWTRRRYLTLMIIYIIAVFIHGLWNALALFGMTTYQLFPESVQRFTGIAIGGLIMMVIVLFAVLISFNRRLQKASPDGLESFDPFEFEQEDDSPPII